MKRKDVVVSLSQNAALETWLYDVFGELERRAGRMNSRINMIEPQKSGEGGLRTQREGVRSSRTVELV